jgi:ketosteroid isomerase-like protein
MMNSLQYRSFKPVGIAISVATIVIALTGCGKLEKSTDDPAAKAAHAAYVTAINSNDLEAFMGMVTDDIAMLGPHEKAVNGKAAVREWYIDYLKTYKTHWDKTQTEFVQSGDWAFEQYTYEELDKPTAGGPDVTDTGKALLVFHHDADGKWRVARDAWNSDLPAKP